MAATYVEIIIDNCIKLAIKRSCVDTCAKIDQILPRESPERIFASFCNSKFIYD